MDCWNAEAALKLVDEIDQCVIDLLPSNLSPNTTASNAEAAAERFLGTVSTLKTSLQALVQQDAPAPTVKQEIVTIKQELAVKEELISDAQQQIDRWQSKCKALLAKHEENMTLV